MKAEYGAAVSIFSRLRAELRVSQVRGAVESVSLIAGCWRALDLADPLVASEQLRGS